MRARRDERLLEAMSTLEPLILDELGVEVPDRTGDFLWCFFELMSQRWRNRRQTLITTNVTPAVFHRRYSEHANDRIQNCGKCVIVKGISLRRPTTTK
jgi:DNA replication protein DnaC